MRAYHILIHTLQVLAWMRASSFPGNEVFSEQCMYAYEDVVCVRECGVCMCMGEQECGMCMVYKMFRNTSWPEIINLPYNLQLKLGCYQNAHATKYILYPNKQPALWAASCDETSNLPPFPPT